MCGRRSCSRAAPNGQASPDGGGRRPRNERGGHEPHSAPDHPGHRPGSRTGGRSRRPGGDGTQPGRAHDAAGAVHLRPVPHPGRHEHPGPQGRVERQGADHVLVPVDALQPGRDGLQPGARTRPARATRSSRGRRAHDPLPGDGEELDGSTKGLSNATQEIAGSPQEPSATAAPTISGSAVVGQTLTANPGTWKGTQPISYSYAWDTCTADLLSCQANGGHAKTYTVASSDAGRRILVKVVGKNSVGQNSAHSLPTDAVKQSGGGGAPGTAISVNDVGPAGDRLVVDQVQFSPNPVTSRSQPITVRIRIKNTKGQLVRGALVSIQSTPVVASIPTPQATGEDGRDHVHDPARRRLPAEERIQRPVLREGVPPGRPDAGRDLRHAARPGQDQGP